MGRFTLKDLFWATAIVAGWAAWFTWCSARISATDVFSKQVIALLAATSTATVLVVYFSGRKILAAIVISVILIALFSTIFGAFAGSFAAPG